MNIVEERNVSHVTLAKSEFAGELGSVIRLFVYPVKTKYAQNMLAKLEEIYSTEEKNTWLT